MKFRLLRPMLRAWRSKAYQSGTLGRSLAIGMVIGFSPTVGAQAILCLIFGLIWNRVSDLKMNMPAMLVGSIVVNPITMGPTYFLYYKIGCLFTTCYLDMSAEKFGSFGAITDFGQSIIIPVVIGSIPFVVAGAPIGYWMGRRIERFLDRRRLRRKERGTLGFAPATTK